MKSHNWVVVRELPEYMARGTHRYSMTSYKCTGCGTEVDCETGTVESVVRRGRGIVEDCEEQVLRTVHRS